MHKHQGFSALAIIILLAILASGGYWVWQNQFGSPTSKLAPTVVDTNIEPLTASGWKTYRNEKNGIELFEFKYPVNHIVIDNEPNSDKISVFESDKLIFSVLFTEGGEFGNDYHFIFSGNDQAFKQIFSTFRFTDTRNRNDF